jgi:hypothetical protein
MDTTAPKVSIAIPSIREPGGSSPVTLAGADALVSVEAMEDGDKVTVLNEVTVLNNVNVDVGAGTEDLTRLERVEAEVVGGNKWLSVLDGLGILFESVIDETVGVDCTVDLSIGGGWA